jgi:predicted unusual protein kinase regulating ubiquinone biosynthesis (AarF/ABC1/UbiB family)
MSSTGDKFAARTDQYSLDRRYRKILRFAALALVQTWWFELVLPKFGLSKFVAKHRTARLQKLARKFRVLAAELGGLVIKAGQFLSARIDLLPVEITKELEGLQDEVAPEPFELVRNQIESQLGFQIEQAFATFDPQPIAAASLGQAHRARLSSSLAADLGFEDVIVKVLRPGIEAVVEVDLKALRKVGVWLSRVKLVSRRADAPALVEEFATTSYEEIDYLHEAANLERFANDFANDPWVATPVVVWERTAKKVLVLNDVSAIKISDVDSLQAAGIDPNAVAAELARVTFQQMFVTGFFHADPHPGNIFVAPASAENPAGNAFTLIFVDFGMMGEVSSELRSELQRFLFAIVARDARAYVASIQRLGVLLPSADTVELERAVSALFERFAGLGVADLTQTDPREIRDFALRFSEIVRTLPFQLPENFLLLFRAISLISGVTSSLNREFNMWDAVDPFARTLLNGGANSTLRGFGRELIGFANTLVGLPARVDNLLARIDRGEVTTRNPELEKRVRSADVSIRRAISALLFSTLLIGGLVTKPGDEVLGWVLIAGSALPLISAINPWRLR